LFSNKIDCFLLQFTAYTFIGLPIIAGFVPFGLPFTNLSRLLPCLYHLCVHYWCLQ